MLLERLRRLLRSKLAGDAMIMTIGNGLRLLLNLLSFIIVAGTMGSHEFGAFATTVSIVNIAGTFSGWGSSQLVVRRIARNPDELPEALGTFFGFLAVTAPVLIVFVALFIPLVVSREIPLEMILLVAGADIVFTRINLVAAACFQGRDRPIGTAILNVIYSLFRVVAALIWITAIKDHDAVSWSWCYFAVTALVALVSISQVTRRLGRPRWAVEWSSWKDGFHFSLQMATASVFRDVDKPVVAGLSSLSTVGVYAAAFRISDAAVMPIQALMYATFARFFRLGAAGPRHSLKFALQLLPFSVGMGVLAGVAIAVVAPFAPTVLGHGYVGTTNALFIFSFFPPLYALYFLAADVLVASDHVLLRTVIQLIVPIIDVGLCFVLVPRFGAEGAAMAAVLTHLSAGILAWGSVVVLVRGSSAPDSDARDGVAAVGTES